MLSAEPQEEASSVRSSRHHSSLQSWGAGEGAKSESLCSPNVLSRCKYGRQGLFTSTDPTLFPARYLGQPPTVMLLRPVAPGSHDLMNFLVFSRYPRIYVSVYLPNSLSICLSIYILYISRFISTHQLTYLSIYLSISFLFLPSFQFT